MHISVKQRIRRRWKPGYTMGSCLCHRPRSDGAVVCHYYARSTASSMDGGPRPPVCSVCLLLSWPCRRRLLAEPEPALLPEASALWWCGEEGGRLLRLLRRAEGAGLCRGAEQPTRLWRWLWRAEASGSTEACRQYSHMRRNDGVIGPRRRASWHGRVRRSGASHLILLLAGRSPALRRHAQSGDSARQSGNCCLSRAMCMCCCCLGDSPRRPGPRSPCSAAWECRRARAAPRRPRSRCRPWWALVVVAGGPWGRRRSQCLPPCPSLWVRQ